MQQIVIGGQLVAYEQAGKGSKQLVIFHGWGARGGEWIKIARELEKRYKVTVFDLPGFGNSSLPPDTWGVDEYADLMEQVLKQLKIIDPVIVGHSFGGRIALILGSRRVGSRLILIDGAGMEMKSLKIKIYQGVIKSTPGRVVKIVMPRSIKEHFWSDDYKAAGKMQSVFKRVISEPLRDRLEQIKIPTLIIWGEKDIALPLSEAKYMREHIKGSVLRIVWGASHWPHLEKTEELIAILEEENV